MRTRRTNFQKKNNKSYSRIRGSIKSSPIADDDSESSSIRQDKEEDDIQEIDDPYTLFSEVHGRSSDYDETERTTFQMGEKQNFSLGCDLVICSPSTDDNRKSPSVKQETEEIDMSSSDNVKTERTDFHIENKDNYSLESDLVICSPLADNDCESPSIKQEIEEIFVLSPDDGRTERTSSQMENETNCSPECDLIICSPVAKRQEIEEIDVSSPDDGKTERTNFQVENRKTYSLQCDLGDLVISSPTAEDDACKSSSPRPDIVEDDVHLTDDPYSLFSNMQTMLGSPISDRSIKEESASEQDLQSSMGESSNFETGLSEVQILKKKLQELEEKNKLKSEQLQILKEEVLDKTSKLLTTEKLLACKAASVVGLRLDNYNIKKSMEQISEEKNDLYMRLDAKDAELLQYKYLVENYKTKEEQNESTKKKLDILQKKNKRAERKNRRLQLKNEQLHRRIIFSRKINKQSMNMLEEIKQMTGKLLPAKEKRKISILTTEIKKSLNIDIDE